MIVGFLQRMQEIEILARVDLFSHLGAFEIGWFLPLLSEVRFLVWLGLALPPV